MKYAIVFGITSLLLVAWQVMPAATPAHAVAQSLETLDKSVEQDQAPTSRVREVPVAEHVNPEAFKRLEQQVSKHENRLRDLETRMNAIDRPQASVKCPECDCDCGGNCNGTCKCGKDCKCCAPKAVASKVTAKPAPKAVAQPVAKAAPTVKAAPQVVRRVPRMVCDGRSCRIVYDEVPVAPYQQPAPVYQPQPVYRSYYGNSCSGGNCGQPRYVFPRFRRFFR